MDPSRFDALTKALGHARSRRTLLRTLGATALGALGLGGASAVEAAPPSGAGPCKRPNTKCGKGKTAVCTNLSTDNNNCGACGIVCAGGTTCSTGACVCPAATPNLCNGQCTNLSTDNNKQLRPLRRRLPQRHDVQQWDLPVDNAAELPRRLRLREPMPEHDQPELPLRYDLRRRHPRLLPSPKRLRRP